MTGHTQRPADPEEARAYEHAHSHSPPAERHRQPCLQPGGVPPDRGRLADTVSQHGTRTRVAIRAWHAIAARVDACL